MPEYYEDKEAMEAQAKADAEKATQLLEEKPRRRSSKINRKTRRIPNIDKEPSNIAVGVAGSRPDKPIVLDGSLRMDHFLQQLEKITKEQELKLHAMLLEHGIDLDDPVEVMFALIEMQDAAAAAIGLEANFMAPRPRVSPSAKEILFHENNPDAYDAFFPTIKQAIREGYMMDPEEQEEYRRIHQQGPDYFIPGIFRKLNQEYKGSKIINRMTPTAWDKVRDAVENRNKSAKGFYEALKEKMLFTGSYIQFRKYAGLYKKRA